MPRLGRFIPGNDLAPIVQETGWVPGEVWMGAQNVAPQPGFDSARSEPLYRLSHLGPWDDTDGGKKNELLGEKSMPVPLRPLQKSCGPGWDRSLVSAVRGRT